MGDQKYIYDILSNNPIDRKRGLSYLYKDCLPKVSAFISKNSGSLEEAKDIFQDSVTILYKHLLDKKFRGESSLSSYTFAIAKNLWFMKLRKTKKMIGTENLEITVLEERDSLNLSLIHKLLEGIGETCKTLLISFYHHSKSMKEIAHNFGLGSEQAAKTKKLRCMKKLSAIVAEHNLKQEDFWQ